MLTDLFRETKRKPCQRKFEFYDTSPEFLDAVRTELALQKQGFIRKEDRFTYRPPRIDYRVVGSGTVAANGRAALTLTAVDTRTGDVVATETIAGDQRNLLTLAETLSVRLARRLCAPDDFPARYRILRAGFEERTSAAKPGTTLCDQVGGTAGSIVFSGALPAPLREPTVEVKRTPIGLSGQFFPKMPAKWTNHRLKGCIFTVPGGIQPCETQAPDRAPVPDGLAGKGFAISGSKGSSVELTWSVSNPSVGFFDATNAECNVYIFGNLPLEALLQTVPLERFTSRQPVTLTFSGSRHLDADGLRHPASIDHSWSFSITFQRVN